MEKQKITEEMNIQKEWYSEAKKANIRNSTSIFKSLNE